VLTEKQSDRRPVRRTSWISYPILWTPCKHQSRPTYPSPPHSRRSSDATRAWPKSLAWKTIPNAVPNPGSSRKAEVKCSLTDGKTQRGVPRPPRPSTCTIVRATTLWWLRIMRPLRPLLPIAQESDIYAEEYGW